MSAEKTLVFYLEPAFRKRAEAGRVNFINKVVTAFASRGFQVEFCGNSDAEILGSIRHPGPVLYWMEDPVSPRGLTMRLAYFYPFWRIENSARRWEWEVARTKFVPEGVEHGEASGFVQQWRRRLFGADALDTAAQGYVYIPLQGRLTEKRSFQHMSPLDMIGASLLAEPRRQIIVGLHPKETYPPDELRALDEMIGANSRLSLSRAAAAVLVRGADYIVTQNSAVALTGYFFHKPAVLFGRIDFHHIAANVHELGVRYAFDQVRQMAPDYDRYLFWFLQKMSINAGREDAEAQILRTVRARGWQV